MSGCAFSPDGTRIVTASSDDTARVWDSTTGHATGGIVVGAPARSASWSGRRVAVAAGNRFLVFDIVVNPLAQGR